MARPRSCGLREERDALEGALAAVAREHGLDATAIADRHVPLAEMMHDPRFVAIMNAYRTPWIRR